MAAEVFANAFNLHSNLLNAWKTTTRQLDEIEEILNQLKPFLLQLHYLPHTGDIDKKNLQLVRDVLEIAVLWSIEKEDVVLFQRYMCQLKSYYFDYQKILPESPYKYQLLGLNLLQLLAQNRLAEFHTELELLPVEKLSDVYISYPVSLEQHLMEGSYHKVFLSKLSLPAANYHFFVDILMQTIQEEIASCAESAYEKILVSEAAKLLWFDSQEELEVFGKKREWKLDESGQYFLFNSEEKQREDAHFIKSVPLILQSLTYAKELEKIV